MTNEIPKFPRRDSINMECSMIIGDYEKWRVDALQKLEKRLLEIIEDRDDVGTKVTMLRFHTLLNQVREALK